MVADLRSPPAEVTFNFPYPKLVNKLKEDAAKYNFSWEDEKLAMLITKLRETAGVKGRPSITFHKSRLSF